MITPSIHFTYCNFDDYAQAWSILAIPPLLIDHIIILYFSNSIMHLINKTLIIVITRIVR